MKKESAEADADMLKPFDALPSASSGQVAYSGHSTRPEVARHERGRTRPSRMEPWGFEPQIQPCHGRVIPFHYGPAARMVRAWRRSVNLQASGMVSRVATTCCQNGNAIAAIIYGLSVVT